MEQLAEESSDKEYLETEEFIDLALKAFESAVRTRDDEKIRLYARILTESPVRAKQDGYSPEEYLSLLSVLTPREVWAALFLRDPSDRAASARGGQQ